MNNFYIYIFPRALYCYFAKEMYTPYQEIESYMYLYINAIYIL